MVRRHQRDTKTFEELTAKEQALAINAHTVWYLKAARAHGRRIGLQKSTGKIARQLRDFPNLSGHRFSSRERYPPLNQIAVSGQGERLSILGDPALNFRHIAFVN